MPLSFLKEKGILINPIVVAKIFVLAIKAAREIKQLWLQSQVESKNFDIDYEVDPVYHQVVFARKKDLPSSVQHPPTGLDSAPSYDGVASSPESTDRYT